MFGIYDMNIDTVLNYKERLYTYKKYGFKEVAIYLDNAYQKENETYFDIISYARKIGLKIKQVHIDYKKSNLLASKETDEYFDYIQERLSEAYRLNIPYVVAHASKGDTPPSICENNIEKFRSLMQRFENMVTLCIENVRNNDNLDRLLSLNLSNVKVCFDLGHAHAYGDENELLSKYLPHIICSHLHNNFGKDSHQALDDGEIDYTPIISTLSKIPFSSNCLECFPPKPNGALSKSEFEEFVCHCYQTIEQF